MPEGGFWSKKAESSCLSAPRRAFLKGRDMASDRIAPGHVVDNRKLCSITIQETSPLNNQLRRARSYLVGRVPKLTKENE